MEIIAPDHSRVFTGDAQFNCYASVKISDLKKIALVLKHGKLPWHIRILVKKKVDEKIKKLEKGASEITCP